VLSSGSGYAKKLEEKKKYIKQNEKNLFLKLEIKYMALSIEQKLNLLIKNFDVLSKNLIEKDEACADLLKKVLEYSPEKSFDLWVRLLNDDYAQKSSPIISLYEVMDKALPEKMIDFILSKSPESKNFIKSEYFQIGGTDVYEYLRWGNSLHNGVIFLINEKRLKKLSEYLSYIFSLNKAEKFKANLIKAVLYNGNNDTGGFSKDVLEILEHFISKIEEKKIELEIYYALITYFMEHKKNERAFKLWIEATMIDGFLENDNLVQLTKTFSEYEPLKIAASILKKEALLHRLIESEYFEIKFISNSVAHLFNINNNKKANEYLRLIFINSIDKTVLKDFLVNMMNNNIKQLDEEGLEIFTGFIETFSDEEFNAELTTALIKFM
jgi:hypothetical protein